MGRKYALSEEQVSFIKNNWSKMTNREIASHVGITEDKVSRYGRYLHLKGRYSQYNMVVNQKEVPKVTNSQLRKAKQTMIELEQVRATIQIGQQFNFKRKGLAEVIFKGVNFVTFQFYKNSQKTYPECFFYSQLKR